MKVKLEVTLFFNVNDAVLMPISSKLNKGKAIRFQSKQGHLQPHFHSKTKQEKERGPGRSLVMTPV